MLEITTILTQFQEYYKTATASRRSVQALASRLAEFRNFLAEACQDRQSWREISYQDLITFTSQFQSPSVHVAKSRVWTLRVLFRFLLLHGLIDDNPAARLPFPKIAPPQPLFLTTDEFATLLTTLAASAETWIGLRNLGIAMLLGGLGIRMAGVLALDCADVDRASGFIWIAEKGRTTKRRLPLPAAVARVLETYVTLHPTGTGPLFISWRGSRLAERTINQFLKDAAARAGLTKALHAHVLRHTAATALTQTGSLEIAQAVLGHESHHDTEHYSHQIPDRFADYLRRHPFLTGSPGNSVPP